MFAENALCVQLKEVRCGEVLADPNVHQSLLSTTAKVE